MFLLGLPRVESTCQIKKRGFNSWVGKILWRRKWQPTPVFLPRKFHGQRNLYMPWGHKELDMTEPTEHKSSCLCLFPHFTMSLGVKRLYVFNLHVQSPYSLQKPAKCALFHRTVMIGQFCPKFGKLRWTMVGGNG